jgi:two-component system sensor histidine kinase UhpB
MLRAEADERSRIAADLHDDSVQVLTATLLSLDRVLAGTASGETAREAIAAARPTLSHAVERTRRLMFELRPAVLHDHGLLTAIRVLADQIARETGARAEVRGTPNRYDLALEELVYRTVREAVTNARRHSAARLLRVEVHEQAGRLAGAVVDDGRGFDPREAARLRNSIRVEELEPVAS